MRKVQIFEFGDEGPLGLKFGPRGPNQLKIYCWGPGESFDIYFWEKMESQIFGSFFSLCLLLYKIQLCKTLGFCLVVRYVILGKMAQHARLLALLMAKPKGKSKSVSNMAFGQCIGLQHIQRSMF